MIQARLRFSVGTITVEAAAKLFQGKRKPHSSQAREAGLGVQRATTGEPPELLLFVSGRDAVRVEFDGDPQTIAAVRAAPRGL